MHVALRSRGSDIQTERSKKFSGWYGGERRGGGREGGREGVCELLVISFFLVLSFGSGAA